MDPVTIILTVITLVLLVVGEGLPAKSRTRVVFAIADAVICVYFLGEFTYRLRRAGDRRAFWKRHWIDLVASIPMPPGIGQHLRWGRLVRLSRALRILRGVRVIALLSRLGIRGWDRYRARPVQLTLVLAAFATLAGAVVMTYVERPAAATGGAGIATFGDALWWSIVTVSTVGYGDLSPVTGIGRLIAAALIIIGVAVFGSASAILASRLVEHAAEPTDAQRHEELLARLERIETTQQEPPAPQAVDEQRHRELLACLAQIEQTLRDLSTRPATEP